MTLDEAIQYAEDLGTEEENKIDKLTDTLYSQLGISKDMLTETATKCYQKATYKFLEKRGIEK